MDHVICGEAMSTIVPARATAVTIEPRSRLIIRSTVQAINATNLNVLKFAAQVAENYMALIAPNDRVIDFYEQAGTMKSLLRAEKRNGCIVDRLIKGVVRFPDDLEEAWIDALPDPYRCALVRELAARYGLSGARLPAASSLQAVVNLADVLHDAGELAKALAPACADGRITMEDAPHIAVSLAQIDRSIDDLLTLKNQLSDALVRHGAVAASLRAVR
jgi:hypothetical protein